MLLNNSHSFMAFSSNEPNHNIREFSSLHLFNFNFLIISSTRLLFPTATFILCLSPLFLFVCSLLEALPVCHCYIYHNSDISSVHILLETPPKRKYYIKSLSHRRRWKQDAGNALKYDVLLACSSMFSFIYCLFIELLFFFIFDVSRGFGLRLLWINGWT